MGEVSSPLSRIRSGLLWILGTGIAERSACVYGWSGFLNKSSADAFR